MGKFILKKEEDGYRNSKKNCTFCQSDRFSFLKY